MVKKVVLLLLAASLVFMPAYASDSETEVTSDVESTSDNQDPGTDDNQADTLVVLNEIKQSVDDTNQYLTFSISVTLASCGVLLGFLAGKELFKIWIN